MFGTHDAPTVVNPSGCAPMSAAAASADKGAAHWSAVDVGGAVLGGVVVVEGSVTVVGAAMAGGVVDVV